MRLLSVTVSNYRIHRELQVDFETARTLIGGSNETGKSTLVEAVHRALFVKAKGTSETHRSMKSAAHPGHPEVALTFESGKSSYRIAKRFSGASGTATLTQIGGSTWSGEEAETRLAQLLGVDAGTAGKEALGQWSHLWTWQGCSVDDPTEHANSQRDTLLARLQGSEGAAAVMQSETDASVAASIADTWQSFFNKNETPRKDSELARTTEEANHAREIKEQARTSFERLQQAAAIFEEAECTIRASTTSLDQLFAQKVEVDTKLARVTELRSSEKLQSLAAESAAEKHEAVRALDEQATNLRAEIEKLTGKLAPKDAETEGLVAAEAAFRKQQSETESEYRKAIEKSRSARLSHALASEYDELFEETARRVELKLKLERVRELRATAGRLESELASLPVVEPGRLKDLEKLEKARAKAEASMTAMATGIEVIATNVPVKVASTLLNPGKSHVVTEETEVVLGDHIWLRITPGGGAGLAEARNDFQEAQSAIQAGLDELGVKSLDAAADACARRQRLEAELATANARMESFGAATIEEDFEETTKLVGGIEASIKRRLDDLKEFPSPKDSAQAALLLATMEAQMKDAEAREGASEAVRDDAGKKLTQAGENLLKHAKSIQGEKETVARLKGQLEFLLKEHGDEAARHRELHALKLASNEAANTLDATRRALVELQPELLNADQERLKRAIEHTGQTKIDAETRRAVALNTLRSDGTDDPQAALAIAEANERAANENLALATRRAEAINRLHKLFVEEQQALAEQFTQPLVEKVSVYLQCLFGPVAQAKLQIENNTFNGLTLARAGESLAAFAFDTLSGGAKEQVAAAVRLAMAEVLAAGHDGCLPIVFDDAFAYSDPNRVQTLQRMLDLAAQRGLQVIVLTCNPVDYAALGAKQILLAN